MADSKVQPERCALDDMRALESFLAERFQSNMDWATTKVDKNSVQPPVEQNPAVEDE